MSSAAPEHDSVLCACAMLPVSQVMSEGKVTYEMIMDQLSVAFQRAFVAFPLR
jgi:hypothetical protein